MTTDYRVQTRVPKFSEHLIFSDSLPKNFLPQNQYSPEGRLSQTLQGKHIKKLLHARGGKKKKVFYK